MRRPHYRYFSSLLLGFVISSILFCLLLLLYLSRNEGRLFKMASSQSSRKFEDGIGFNEADLKEMNGRIWMAVEREQQQRNGSHLNCGRILSGDEDYIREKAKKRLIYEDPADLAMDCGSIRARNHFLDKRLSSAESHFPLAYARIVFQDYRFVEAELATNYSPQNWYCFSVDSKAKADFKARIHALAKCFRNVLIPEREFSLDSAGHYMGMAFMSCLAELAKAQRRWEYVLVLQNHDVQVKTNEEMVQIFKWLGGANDIQFEFAHANPQGMIRELQRRYDWSFRALQLFKNESLNQSNDSNGKPLRLNLAKGQVQSSLARPFVDFLVKQLDLSKMMAQLDSWYYGEDELFFQTLGASDHLNAPGAFTHRCYDAKIDVPHITRYTVWDYGPGRWENVGQCHSKIMRHYICLLGLEDLSKNLRDCQHLFVNKMMPSTDFGAILCWHEEMRRRTLLARGLDRLQPEVYQNWPQTRFVQGKMQSPDFDAEHFVCTTPNTTYDPFTIFKL